MVPGTRTRSIGPSPRASYAIETPSASAYRTEGKSLLKPRSAPPRQEAHIARSGVILRAPIGRPVRAAQPDRSARTRCTVVIVLAARKALLAVAAVVGLAAVVVACIPFSLDSSSAVSGYLINRESCGPPISDAVRGSDTRFAIPIGAPSWRAGVSASTCRSEARHRLGLSTLGLLAAAALVVIAWWLGRPTRERHLSISPS